MYRSRSEESTADFYRSDRSPSRRRSLSRKTNGGGKGTICLIREPVTRNRHVIKHEFKTHDRSFWSQFAYPVERRLRAMDRSQCLPIGTLDKRALRDLRDADASLTLEVLCDWDARYADRLPQNPSSALTRLMRRFSSRVGHELARGCKPKMSILIQRHLRKQIAMLPRGILDFEAENAILAVPSRNTAFSIIKDFEYRTNKGQIQNPCAFIKSVCRQAVKVLIPNPGRAHTARSEENLRLNFLALVRRLEIDDNTMKLLRKAPLEEATAILQNLVRLEKPSEDHVDSIMEAIQCWQRKRDQEQLKLGRPLPPSVPPPALVNSPPPPLMAPPQPDKPPSLAAPPQPDKPLALAAPPPPTTPPPPFPLPAAVANQKLEPACEKKGACSAVVADVVSSSIPPTPSGTRRTPRADGDTRNNGRGRSRSRSPNSASKGPDAKRCHSGADGFKEDSLDKGRNGAFGRNKKSIGIKNPRASSGPPSMFVSSSSRADSRRRSYR